MKVLIDESFEKDISEISNRKLRTKVADIIEHIEGCHSLIGIPNLKKAQRDD